MAKKSRQRKRRRLLKARLRTGKRIVKHKLQAGRTGQVHHKKTVGKQKDRELVNVKVRLIIEIPEWWIVK